MLSKSEAVNDLRATPVLSHHRRVLFLPLHGSLLRIVSHPADLFSHSLHLSTGTRGAALEGQRGELEDLVRRVRRVHHALCSHEVR